MLLAQGLDLDDPIIARIVAFGDLVLRYNKMANLISEGDEAKIASRHLLDSLQPLRIPSLIPEPGSKWADLGSGAGFPVFPLCIAKPEIQFYAVEPRLKRSTFLKMAQHEIGITNLIVLESNAESAGLAELDRVSCRALGSAKQDWARAEPILKSSGVFITLKSLRDCSLLPPNLWTISPYELPGETQPYCVTSRIKVHG